MLMVKLLFLHLLFRHFVITFLILYSNLMLLISRLHFLNMYFHMFFSNILFSTATRRFMLSAFSLRMVALIYILFVFDGLIILALYRDLLRVRNFMYLEEMGIAILNLADWLILSSYFFVVSLLFRLVDIHWFILHLLILFL